MKRTPFRRPIAVSLGFWAIVCLGPSAGQASSELLDRPAVQTGKVVSVDEMPDQMRAAYLTGIRKQLADHGYSPGSSLKGAIRTYQRDARLPVTGVASQQLLDHLMFARPRIVAGRRDTAPAPTTHTYAKRVPTPSSARSMPKLPREPVALQELPPPSDTIVPATNPPSNPGGGVVSRVQEQLKSLGYYDGPVDGAFGPRVSDAVRRFQTDRGLAVSGVVDSRLLNALSPPATASREE